MERLLILFLFIGVAFCDPSYRLSTPIKPSAYNIRISPIFDSPEPVAFDGEVTIIFRTDTPINQIQLHSSDLNFTTTDITLTPSIAITSLSFNETLQFAFINLASDLQANIDYSLTIVYRGPVRTDLYGFYGGIYTENGQRKWVGATQMEPTHARQTFPCFDEPQLKATFTIALDRPANYTTVSNMKRESTTDLPNGYQRDLYYPTPIMSTYLVAFAVSQFVLANQSPNPSRSVGIYVRPDAANQTDFTYEFAVKVVDRLGEYFNVDYFATNPNLKLDHIGLPDFNAGAMENWGLVTYRESLVLYIPEDSSAYYKYRVAQIVAHETTHMWFGNLVTCHWWSDAWLNEGFANYFQDYITSLIEPEIRSDNILVTGSVYSAYNADESPSATPISNPNVYTPSQISGNFGTITYQKGGSVIRMMHHLIGDEAFRAGLNSYLTNSRLSSGYPEQLYAGLNTGVQTYDSLAAYPGFNISGVMGSWISQPGHPVLEVNVDYANKTATLTQRRFYSNSSHQSDEIYQIPITYTISDSIDFTNTKPAFILGDRSIQIDLNITENSWVLFNIQETGLYRVNYDDASWNRIANALKGEDRLKIHNLNRAKIVNDLFAFYFADEIPFERLYSVIEYLALEDDYSVWLAALSGLKKLRSRYLGSDVLGDLERTALQLARHAINELGYHPRETDDFESLRNRLELLEFACDVGDAECIQHTVALFRGLVDNNVEVPASIRSVVYCNGLRQGVAGDYDYLWNRMLTTNVANEERTILDVLGCTSNKEKIVSYLTSVLEEDRKIKTQDLSTPLSSVLRTYSNLETVLEAFSCSEWRPGYSLLNSVISTIANALRTDSDFEKFEERLQSTGCQESEINSGRNAVNSIKTTLEWADDHKNEILAQLRNKGITTLPSYILLIAISALATLFV
ncbi:membrane alanyl aminopeptidase-like isoform X2 [Galleria mellonella]|uniref:Aminopeptidase n=1 Tax=Galleria mellonella TaxID=7137 RepID=A0ABM3MQB8_GALME|nr:membrane alanyl aminopeptidase-like isoform X2 [Galleria mellonella]